MEPRFPDVAHRECARELPAPEQRADFGVERPPRNKWSAIRSGNDCVQQNGDQRNPALQDVAERPFSANARHTNLQRGVDGRRARDL
jgi:hypothetical protein